MHTNRPSSIVHRPTFIDAIFTFLFWIIIFILTNIIQLSLMLVLVITTPASFSKELSSFSANGLFLALSTFIQLPLIIGLSILFIRYRSQITLKDFFGLHLPSIKQAIIWLSLTIVLVSLLSGSLYHFNMTEALDWFQAIWKSTSYKTMLLISILIIAPLNEEIMYRGVMFTGFLHSKIKFFGAIFIPSFLWAIIHIQYNLMNMFVIFLFGTILGFARYKSNSLVLTIGMHFIWNLIVTGIFLFLY